MIGVPIDDEGRLRQVLDYVGRELEPSILIGGWATVYHVGGEISRDIDFIIDSAVRDKAHEIIEKYSKSHHQKWRGEVNGVHLDVYVPYESELGKVLKLRVEALAEYTSPLGHGEWRLLTLEAHLVSKFAALLDRPDTEKGFKDAREIWRLLEKGVDPAASANILRQATSGPVNDLIDHVDQVFELLAPRAGLNKAQRKVIQRLRREWRDAMVAAVSPKRQRPDLR